MTHQLAIIGGGLSGTLLVLNYLKQQRFALTILWFDKNNSFCKGLAYSTTDDAHLLNVKAGNMSVFTDEPDHFVNWLTQHYPHYKAGDFVPRKIFGEYTLSTYEQLCKNNTLITIRQVAEEVSSVNKNQHQFDIVAGTNNYQATHVVLALGNFLPAHPRSASTQFISSPFYFQDPFSPAIPETLKNNEPVIMIGSGLTMIDVVLTLNRQQFGGVIHVISPHGYLPQQHSENPLPAVSPFIEPDKHYSLSELVAHIKTRLKQAKLQGLNPQSVIDAMRPYLVKLWLGFTLTEKQRFLRHLRHKWGVARHRAPAQSMLIMDQLVQNGQLQIHKGRISDISYTGKGFIITFNSSVQAKNTLEGSVIINCTGPQSNYETIDSPLVKQLINTGFISPDAVNYGINAQKDGQIAQNCYTIGPPLKGILWESTAIPEIRVQAQQLIHKIIFD